jgi:hypothetical protein
MSKIPSRFGVIESVVKALGKFADLFREFVHDFINYARHKWVLPVYLAALIIG